jgi:hypothetical protein
VRRRAFAIIAFVIIGIGIPVLLVTQTPPPSPAAASASPSGSFVPPTAVPSRDPLAPLDSPVVVVDGKFDARVDRSVRGATRHKNQSKLFFAGGQWWGILQEPTTGQARIHRLDWKTQRWHDTGVLVDERPFARADALYTNGKLYITTAGSSVDSESHAVRVLVFDFDEAKQTWTLEPDFPVVVTKGGVQSSIIERASDGTLWVAFIAADRLGVAHSLGDDHTWTAPFRPSAPGTDVATDQVGMVVVGKEVVLLWSNQEDSVIYSAGHLVGDPDETWEDTIEVVASPSIADDHVNAKVLPDGRIFAVVKTSLDTVDNSQPGWDQILLLVRDQGRWSSYQVGQIRDHQTRPIILLDTGHQQALIFATVPFGGGDVYMKHTSVDDIDLPVGPGIPVIKDPLTPLINNSTSTKQNLDASTGLVVLASDDDAGRYVHLAASLGGPAPGKPAAGPPPDGPVPPPGDAVGLVREPFDAFEAGQAMRQLWRTTPTRSNGTVTYVDRGAGDGAVRARTTKVGELRPCRTFGAVTTGKVAMSLDVRIDRPGPTDTNLVLVRGAGDELGAIRVDPTMRLKTSSSGDRVTTNVRVRTGAWYRVSLDVDVAKRTFDARVADAAGHLLLKRTGLRWRGKDARAVDGLCVSPSAGRAGSSLSFDDVTVTRHQ